MHQQSLVSVIIPCYNNKNEKFLRECFDSVKHQTYSPIQLIVIDDGSTNGASELLQQLSAEYDFILEKQQNKGISGALNTGIINHAKGKYIAIMGSDDFWALNKIERQVAFLEAADETVGACCTRGYYKFENDPSKPVPRLTRLHKPDELTFDVLLQRNWIMQMSVMIKRNVLDEIGLFDEKSAIEDWDMWLRITNKYKMAFIEEPLVYYRRHAVNMSYNYNTAWYDSMKYIINKWKGKRGHRKSINTIELGALNNFARHQKSIALAIAVKNPQLAYKWLYWRGIMKIFIPGFIFSKSKRN